MAVRRNDRFTFHDTDLAAEGVDGRCNTDRSGCIVCAEERRELSLPAAAGCLKTMGYGRMATHRSGGVLPGDHSPSGVQQLCVVYSNLTGVKNDELIKKRKERRLFFKGKKYYLCAFEVKAIIGPADLKFELWFGGKRFSGNYAPVEITWDDEGAKVGGA
jgi:hypothetical protein